MKKSIVCMFLMALPAVALADNTPAAGCDFIRNAQATVFVTKTSYVQKNGIWEQSSQEAGRTTASIPVVGNSMVGCKIDSVRLDNVQVNGAPISISVSAWIRVITNPNKPVAKRFAADYWTSVSNGREGWAGADTDSSQQSLGLAMNTERSQEEATNHDDVLTVYVRFTDNAQ